MTGEVGEQEARDIDARMARILSDLGNPQPPLRLELVFDLLDLDLEYYRADDVGVFKTLAHKVRLAGKQLAARPELAWEAFRRAQISALWLPDEKRICIDEGVPKPKHRWMQGHEITHAVTDWHRDYLLGDNDSTLDPQCHEMLEAEANYGAGRLLFLRDAFSVEAHDCALDFKTVRLLADRFGNTMTSTFWRMIVDHDPTALVFGMVSQHPRYPAIGEGRAGQPWRDFPRSRAFQRQFSRVTATQVFEVLRRHAGYKKRGPVIDGSDVLIDDNGRVHDVQVDGFCNTHSVMTIGRVLRLRPPMIAVP
jgi:hypothetical protein